MRASEVPKDINNKSIQKKSDDFQIGLNQIH